MNHSLKFVSLKGLIDGEEIILSSIATKVVWNLYVTFLTKTFETKFRTIFSGSFKEYT